MSRVGIFLTIATLAVSSSVDAGEWIEGRVTHVRDVDTVEVNSLPIRLQGVDGPELSERGGRNAKRWMQQIVLRKPVRCWLTGEKNRDRWIGVCYLGDDDIGALAIAAGQARDCPRFSGGRYAKFETAQSRSLTRHGYCK
ncbi:thermonuclease family protein [Roseovarius sp. CAU 1744]|uniref:thermonuclease family protein n=1 Tax=Roseovarius sp. CAU 1744 TaxID=3140368 RepID=UPI00325BFE71